MLPITKAAVKYLRASGVTVISDADTNNNKNMIADVRWANKEGVSIYVSLHGDWYKAPTGTMPLYVSAKGKALATAINKAVMSGMSMKTRGVTKRTDLYELNYTDAPACIFETGSIKADIKKLKESDKYGKCIAQGICNYLGIAFKESAPAPAPAPATQQLYRVRKTWADAKSQVGAFKSLDNAKKECDKHPGYSVFDESGKAVYTSKSAEKTNAQKLAEKANEFAYSTNTKDANYPSGRPKAAYKTALYQVYPNLKKLKSAAAKGASCDVFVGTCVRSAGIDPNFPRGLSPSYLAKSDKFKLVKVTASTIQNGDIIVTSKHICIAYGGKIKEASNGDFYPKTTNTLSKRISASGAKVYRAK
jgi:N-acetylmuramoyl-L-alanine amidase